jgi:hypothetical protein
MNRQRAVRHSQQEYLADEKLLDTATGMNQIYAQPPRTENDPS